MQASTKAPQKLNIAPDLYLPIDTVTSRNAFFGISGSGKTYTSLVLAEEMQAVGAQFVLIDPLGVGWGLRVPVTDAPTGSDVYIFGGPHQDLPLDHTQGAAVADLVVQRNLSVILDLSEFEGDPQRQIFVGAFAQQVYNLNRKPLHIFVDEADIFAQQTPDSPTSFACFKAMDNITRRGRVRGIGVSLITQRPAIVAKNLLTQITLMIVHQLTGRADLDAVKGWIRDNGTDEQLKSVMTALPKLRAGQAIVWKPGGDDPIFADTQIRRRRTFDSSKTPEFGEIIAPVSLTPLDLEELRAELRTAIEQAEDTDPEAQRRLIADLRRQLAERPKPEPKIVERVRVVEKRVPVLEGDALLKVEALREFAAGMCKDMPPFMSLLSALVRDYAPGAAEPPQADPSDQTETETVSEPTEPQVEPEPEPALVPPTAPEQPPVKAPKQEKPVLANVVPESPAPAAPNIKFPDGARRILESLSKHGRQRLSKSQIGAKADLKKNSGTFDAYMRDHLKAGRIEQDGDLYRITDNGMRALGLDPEAEDEPVTTAQLLASWRGTLGNREFEALQMLVAAAPEGLSQEELRKRMGLAAGSGTFGGYIRTLRQLGLIVGDHQRWIAASLLFP